uniref:Uncharacterized protein n=1 Tax=Pithovirus LCDPAC01 TaxID=2506600 RepID=A0A481YML7_9VIRU|nr:MAG: hypothetical protein LCDPAC01_00600 [Pithovirus LCDPAC01]
MNRREFLILFQGQAMKNGVEPMDLLCFRIKDACIQIPRKVMCSVSSDTFFSDCENNITVPLPDGFNHSEIYDAFNYLFMRITGYKAVSLAKMNLRNLYVILSVSKFYLETEKFTKELEFALVQNFPTAKEMSLYLYIFIVILPKNKVGIRNVMISLAMMSDKQKEQIPNKDITKLYDILEERAGSDIDLALLKYGNSPRINQKLIIGYAVASNKIVLLSGRHDTIDLKYALFPSGTIKIGDIVNIRSYIPLTRSKIVVIQGWLQSKTRLCMIYCPYHIITRTYIPLLSRSYWKTPVF